MALEQAPGLAVCEAPVRSAAGTLQPCGGAIAKSQPPRRTVIFLDIDGVLNRRSTPARIGPYVGLDEELVSRFVRLVRRTGSDVVLSSTWRSVPELSSAVRERIDVKDSTPDVAGTRGDQIAAWLRSHPGYDRHAAVDDDREIAEWLMPFFTDPATGLTAPIAEALAHHLTDPAWTHVDPEGPCSVVADDPASLLPRRLRPTCGRPPDAHAGLEHPHRAPPVDRGHAPVPPS